jgi:AcrR family transcriptional regulator
LEGHDLAEIWHEKATTPFLSVVEQAIVSRQAQGFLRGVDAKLAARAFIGMMAHYGLSTTLFRMTLPGFTHREAVDQFVELYLNGLRPRSEETPR